MNEKDTFADVQRLNCTIMAKSQWLSSRIDMQKSSEEVYHRRNKTNRKANEFLRGLLRKRGDGLSFDDRDTLDRYHKFLKSKSICTNDDELLEEFERRLHSLHDNHRRNSKTMNSQSNDEYGIQEKRPKSAADMFNLSITSNVSFNEIPVNFDLNLLKPIARRPDGTEITPNSMVTSLEKAPPNVLLFKHCYFPRKLLSQDQPTIDATVEKKPFPTPTEQYETKEILHLLNQLENDCSLVNFTEMLDRLTVSSVQVRLTDENKSIRQTIDSEAKQYHLTIPNLFDQSSSVYDHFTTLTVDVDDPRKISIYTMTISTVQLSPSNLFPYSILNGRRPLLQCSTQTKFQRIRSKREIMVCKVTAIESFVDITKLRENDIILQINNQSVFRLSIDVIRNILRQHDNKSIPCQLTIARLDQPFI